MNLYNDGLILKIHQYINDFIDLIFGTHMYMHINDLIDLNFRTYLYINGLIDRTLCTHTLAWTPRSFSLPVGEGRSCCCVVPHSTQAVVAIRDVTTILQSQCCRKSTQDDWNIKNAI